MNMNTPFVRRTGSLLIFSMSIDFTEHVINVTMTQRIVE